MHLMFDLDGTLTDPREGIVRCLVHALDAVGAPSPSEAQLLQYIGPPLQESLRELVGEERCVRALAAYRERFSEVGLFENHVFPGVAAMLERLRELGHSLFIVTSKPQPFALRIVEHFGLARSFRAIHGSALTGERSNKAELIAFVLDEESFSPHEAVMIGDREHDVRGARHNGVMAVGVLWGFGSRGELEGAGADRVVEDVPSLLAHVSGLTRASG